ncbi:MAG: MBOAT family protein [Desulfobulbus sp.]|jgi:alginate O-acetyltransferase complex protein AlgI|uniref:MBOAT family O-acyltransferase n=1 Tax=Desulfobulbus sp. TaxID=895 RepID=UPI00284D8C0E|nr:MBOAT family O-acyltransferase [Desulfobulbus sp.]MDR2548593.1 MBOAT family protein [Desulfobulbus sp.]
MIFSSFSFLFFFLPVVLCGYIITPKPVRNCFLFAVSLIFYAWGEPGFVFIMLASIVINYVTGVAVERLKEKGSPVTRTLLAAGIIANLLVLGHYKYTTFLLRSLLEFQESFGVALTFAVPQIPLPIGISFFIFQGISYIVDIYRGQVIAQKNFISLGMYIALFPQLMAGPIVRYQTIEKEITSRNTTLESVVLGLRFFSFGMAKKVIIANGMGAIADAIFALPPGSASLPLAWMGIFAYTFQIYFDFSGYSDMAIGLGLLFGFHFPQNFNYPYIAGSMTDFWRRWHMSLSTWFRDYLYIPLGGNQYGVLKTYRNLFIVFCATGIWHGANWTFLVWGIWHGLFLIAERLFPAISSRMPALARHCYVLLAVILGWVFFRSESIEGAISYMGAMFDLTRVVPEALFFELTNARTGFFFGLGCVFSTPVFIWFRNRFARSFIFENIFSLCLFGISIVFLLNSTYNPFLYFRF